MITGSILGFPAVIMLLMSMPCINLGNEPQSSKNKRAILGGVLILIVGKRLVNIHVNISLNLPDSDHFYTCTRCLQAVVSTGCWIWLFSSLGYTCTPICSCSIEPTPKVPSHSSPPPTHPHPVFVLNNMNSVLINFQRLCPWNEISTLVTKSFHISTAHFCHDRFSFTMKLRFNETSKKFSLAIRNIYGYACF